MVGEAPAKGIVKKSFAERLPRLRAVLRRLGLEERGTALVEFALIAPLLFGLLIGILDFGEGLNYYNQQSQLVGQGARAAAVDCDLTGKVCGASLTNTTIQHELSQEATGELSGEKFCISFPQGQGVGLPVKVSATFNFKLVPLTVLTILTPGASLKNLTQLTITASQTERQEVAPTYSAGCSS
jgi:Flp pilus assembly pilin Flp